ncbi:MAG: 3-oxoacyl-ACP synthase, partial [Bacteroidota bacterium]
MNTIKEQLYQHCKSYLAERIASFQAAIEAARQTASQETKSSMGDKYETTRAMMQIEIEKNERQLAETLKLKEVLHKVNPKSISTPIALGSLVKTNQGSYYLSIGLGKV